MWTRQDCRSQGCPSFFSDHLILYQPERHINHITNCPHSPRILRSSYRLVKFVEIMICSKITPYTSQLIWLICPNRPKLKTCGIILTKALIRLPLSFI